MTKVTAGILPAPASDELKQLLEQIGGAVGDDVPKVSCCPARHLEQDHLCSGGNCYRSCIGRLKAGSQIAMAEKVCLRDRSRRTSWWADTSRWSTRQ